MPEASITSSRAPAAAPVVIASMRPSCSVRLTSRTGAAPVPSMRVPTRTIVMETPFGTSDASIVHGMLVRRAALTLGLLLVGLVAGIAVAVSGAFETDRNQLAGTVASHLGMLLILWGAAPALRRVLTRLDDVADDTLRSMLAIGVVAPTGAVIVLHGVAPRATHQVLTREWGVVEPLQVALYVAAVWLCRAIVRCLPGRDEARALYTAAAILIVVLILEEIDYLGVLALLAELAGARGGRLGRKHIGGLHDVVDAGTQFLGLVVIVAGAIAVLLVVWSLLGRYRAAILREARRPSVVPFAVFVAAMLGAQLTDIDDLLLPPFLPILPIRVLEESLELMAALALSAGLILRLRAARRESGGQ